MRRPHAPPPCIRPKVSALSEGAQPDTRLEVIHLLQMIHPANVDDAQHDLGLELAHVLVADGFFLLVVDAFEILDQGVRNDARIVVMVNRRNAEIGTSRHLGGPALDRFRVPIVARGFRRTILVDDCIRSVRDNIADTAGKVLAVQNGVAFVVDGVTLQVHDVIVFEDVFTGCEMHGFDLALSALDRLRDHARLNGHVVFGAGLFHHAGDGIHAVPLRKDA